MRSNLSRRNKKGPDVRPFVSLCWRVVVGDQSSSLSIELGVGIRIEQFLQLLAIGNLTTKIQPSP